MSTGNGQTAPDDDGIVHAALERLRHRVEKNEAGMEKLAFIVKEMEDAMVVQAHLEKGMTEQLKEHARLIMRHDEFVAYHELKMREFDDKLNALIDILMRRDAGPEARN